MLPAAMWAGFAAIGAANLGWGFMGAGFLVVVIVSMIALAMGTLGLMWYVRTADRAPEIPRAQRLRASRMLAAILLANLLITVVGVLFA
jgi:hypothetical protein